MTRLSSATLASLPAEVAVPAYDRAGITTGIVHIGVGGFHRAHEAMYLDRLLDGGGAREWGICGVGLLPGDARMRDALAAQDGLYTLVLKHPDGTVEARVVGSVTEYLFAPDDPGAVVAKLADPAVRIVSLTITEGGYHLDHVTGEFDADDSGLAADLAAGERPTTAFGLLTEALRLRRERAVAPFTVLSCDNLQGNGDLARRVLTAFAALRDPELGAWVGEHVAFPNSMVDRITPATTPDDVAELRDRFGVEDAWPVVAEPFAQWALQDAFVAGRPAFEDAGVQVVDDVAPYELMKLRLLNASHQGLCYLGWLAGYRLVHDVCRDPLFARFLLAYMDSEATPTLEPVPGIDLAEYKRTLIERFSNAGVRDTVARLCAESSDRIPRWLLPVVRRNLETGGPVRLSAAVVAAWARYAEAVDEQGRPIEVVDRLADRLVPLARRQREEPLAFLGDRAVFGDLVDDERFVAAYREALASLHERGARATVEALVGRGD